MTERTNDDFAHERQALDAAHAINEQARASFVAIGHTALFAASVSFVGNVAPLAVAIWVPFLILAWTADLVGLLALTLSFGAARRAIDARRAALNDEEAPTHRLADVLNVVALWSFPAALLSLFLFATANVVHAHAARREPAVNAALAGAGRGHAATAVADDRGAGGHPAASRAGAGRGVPSADRRRPGAAGAFGPSAAGACPEPPAQVASGARG